ncbi:response regulator [Alicyclobacillus fastidiosus]|uniref:Response regulator transcription factor n=1 Tax=Alicyclobacillus fastidiosus TaxID=392011 RepID=A0ABV5ACQ2_9BACL|nr:response regulator transcription factor [Alicyclobacillus fastidiosus]WEH12029.1 response regulator transcription factor [Alicyclobacillus fastidiosus]
MNCGQERQIRVFIADDQDMIVQGLRYIVDAQADMTVVGVAQNGAIALEQLQLGVADVALIDIRMPELTGIEVVEQLNSRQVGCKVILLTTFDHAEYVQEGIRAGAVGFLLKDSPTEQLLDGIRRAASGEVFYLTANAQGALATLYTAGESKQPMTLLEPLTDRERDVLQCMAQGMRNQEIAEQMCLSIGTVKTHVHRILQKMGAEDRTQAVVWAIRGGLVN